MATNGLIVKDQCRKCGLGGAKKGHFGPVNNEKCVLFKYKLRKEKIKALLPDIQYLIDTKLDDFGEHTKYRAAFVDIKKLQLEGEKY